MDEKERRKNNRQKSHIELEHELSFLQKEKIRSNVGLLLLRFFLFTTVDRENDGKGFRKVSIRGTQATICSEIDSKLECAFYKTNTHTIGSISLSLVNVFTINEFVEQVYNENVFCPHLKSHGETYQTHIIQLENNCRLSQT